MSSINNGDGNNLVVSKDPHATYLSLHNSESQPCLRNTSSTHQVTAETEGKVLLEIIYPCWLLINYLI